MCKIIHTHTYTCMSERACCVIRCGSDPKGGKRGKTSEGREKTVGMIRENPPKLVEARRKTAGSGGAEIINVGE